MKVKLISSSKPSRDMYDEELSREEKNGMSKSMAKLKFLIKKGWVYSPGPKK